AGLGETAPHPRLPAQVQGGVAAVGERVAAQRPADAQRRAADRPRARAAPAGAGAGAAGSAAEPPPCASGRWSPRQAGSASGRSQGTISTPRRTAQRTATSSGEKSANRENAGRRVL